MTNKKYSLLGVYKKAINAGAGFIGSNLVESLLGDGLEVISLDDYSVGKKSNLADVQKKYGNSLKQIHCDITDDLQYIDSLKKENFVASVLINKIENMTLSKTLYLLKN